MYFENLFAEYRGFEPCSQLRLAVKSALETIQNQAPSDSLVKIILEKNNGAFSANGRVVSLSGVYLADSVDFSPDATIEDLKKKLLEKLDSWKQFRFYKEQSQNSESIKQVS